MGATPQRRGRRYPRTVRVEKSTQMRKLKAGLALFHSAHHDRFYCGTHKRAVRINTLEEKSLLHALSVGGEEAWGDSALVDRLVAAGLIDESQGVITLSKRFTSKIAERAEKNKDRTHDGAYAHMQKRLAPELNQSTWVDGVVDTGASLVSARQGFTVEISGSSRVALLLYPLLLASGVTDVRFASNFRKKNPCVDDSDIGLARISQEDIGITLRTLCQSWRRDIALFPIDKDIDYEDTSEGADLKIHCGVFDPEILSLWMSTGQNFLHIAEPEGDRATIGPLVIPGKSPCIRCFHLSITDSSDILGVTYLRDDANREFPMIAAHHIASLAAWQVIQFLDWQTLGRGDLHEESGRAELVGSVIAVDYQLLSRPEVIALARHPLCGCAF